MYPVVKKKTYWQNIGEGISTLLQGMKLAFRHLWQARKSRKPLGVDNANYFDQQTGIVTLQYPHEAIPVPDNGRYRLHNEIDDCIVCDLCAKICPVNCIEIEAIRSPEEIGKTSDGSTKRLYAGKFDIDMAKCCYCGLCTTVCPTECLTMTKTYDYSEFDIRNMVYHFTDLSPEKAEEQRKIFEESQRLKAELKKGKEEINKLKGITEFTALPEKKKAGPVVIPGKKQQPDVQPEEKRPESEDKKPAPKFIPKPVIRKPAGPAEEKGSAEAGKPQDSSAKKPAPVIPSIKKPGPHDEGNVSEEKKEESAKPAPKFIPRPVIQKKKPKSEGEEPQEKVVQKTPGPVIPPIKKPETPSGESDGNKNEESPKKPAPKFIPKPIIKKPKQNPDNES